MSFKIENPRRVVQMASDGSSVYYVGQIVTYIAASKAATPGTVLPLAVPAGAADTTNFQIPAGVVVGINNRTPVYGATLKANSVTGLTTQATQLARDWGLNKGMYAIGDPQVLLDVAIIEPCSLIEGPIYNAAYGTAPTVVTDTGGADTTGYTSAGTTGACDFTPVANYATIYCRTGANAGLYRTTTDTSTTAPAVTVGFPYDVAAGDTFVRVPVKQGYSRIYIDGPGMYIAAEKTPATHYFSVFVEKLDLAVAGSCKALFRFANVHFDPMRA
jgi:hypothetical protein